MDKIRELGELIERAKNLVFFGGAGVSTESNIPDFRSADGIFSRKYKRTLSPEVLVSHSFYRDSPEEFFDFYIHNLIYKEAVPNACHLYLAELEKRGKLSAIVTQNIDGLHQMAGSKAVYELHGSIHRNYCETCHRFYDLDAFLDRVKEDGLPRCDCGGIIKPDVVLYEEGLDAEVLTGAIRKIASADMLIIGGTSLLVYPAAGLIDYFRGDKLVMINLTPTGRDFDVDLLIREKIGKVFTELGKIG